MGYKKETQSKDTTLPESSKKDLSKTTINLYNDILYEQDEIPQVKIQIFEKN